MPWVTGHKTHPQHNTGPNSNDSIFYVHTPGKRNKHIYLLVLLLYQDANMIVFCWYNTSPSQRMVLCLSRGSRHCFYHLQVNLNLFRLLCDLLTGSPDMALFLATTKICKINKNCERLVSKRMRHTNNADERIANCKSCPNSSMFLM